MNKAPISLITGCNGFVGYWLINLLKMQSHEIIGIDNSPTTNLSDIKYYQIDILDSETLSKLIKEFQPDFIFHLAAISFLPEADKSPRKALLINISGSINLFEAIKDYSPKSKLLYVGSSKQYGNIHGERITEDERTEPSNFYGISKQSGEMIGRQYAHDFGLQIYFARSFNHTGPGQSPRFVCSDWASQVAKIALRKSEPVIKVGDIGSSIDFLDVRDVVSAYVSILNKGKASETYNVCSGKAIDLKWILLYLSSKTDIEIKIEEESARKRNHSIHKLLTGDNTKLKNDTGWNKSIPFETTLDDLYNWIYTNQF